MFNENGSKVLLIEKNKPEWLAGKLNAIGGEIDEDEAPMTAMIREFKEKTGVSFVGWTPFCQLDGYDPDNNLFIVYFFCANSDLAINYAKTMEEEQVKGELVHNNSRTEAYAPNLNWLLDMAWSTLFGNDSCKYFAITEKPESN